MAWGARNPVQGQSKGPGKSEPRLPASKLFYLDYCASMKNQKFLEIIFKVFPNKAKPSDNDVERLLSHANEAGKLVHGKRVFASAQLPIESSDLRTVTELDSIYGEKGVIEKITRSYVSFSTEESVMKLPNYAPQSYRIGDTVTMAMQVQDEKCGNGYTLAALIEEANAGLAPILPSQTPENPEATEPPKSFIIFVDKHFVATIDKYPCTIGTERLMIQSQRLLFPNKEFWTNQIRELEPNFSSWRKSRGDGNCYYRAVSVSFVETMLRYGKISELKKLYDRLLRQDDYEVPAGFEAHHFYFLKSFGHFLNLHQHSDRIVAEFQQLEQDYAFDSAMIGVFRSMAGQWLLKNQGHDEIFPFIMDTGVDPIVREILTDEREGEGLAFVAMANVLSAKVNHIIVDQNVTKTHTETFTPFSGQFDVEFSLLLRPGHYDLIYMREHDEKDRYNLMEQRFS